ncbi:hypothetical protein PCC6912_62250 [Chlorogloeopsis fritschii PCC 6912]|uniref:Uncharacterized protein n=1 Tax=Chlorogloeopsis fritschii PCC 6912 TaxID=211165 RepID=A0A3S0ZUI7_CHLFR|nr:hypothetical protein PCC6912_62250 [Chlorogloeopsis fritschii PCC 6912]
MDGNICCYWFIVFSTLLTKDIKFFTKTKTEIVLNLINVLINLSVANKIPNSMQAKIFSVDHSLIIRRKF